MDFSSYQTALKSLERRRAHEPELLPTLARLRELDNSTPKPCLYNSKGSVMAENAPSSEQLEPLLSTLLTHRRWDCISVGLILVERFFPYLTQDFIAVFRGTLHAKLDHPEPRLRTIVARVLGVIAAHCGTPIVDEFQNQILDSIHENFQRGPSFEEEEEEEEDEDQLTEEAHAPHSPIDSPPSTPGTPKQVLDDTTGWRSLETSLCAMKSIMEGCGTVFLEQGYITEKFLDTIIVQPSKHINRHVRAVAHQIIAVISELSTEDKLLDISDVLSPALMHGLQDNWSQVRYEASVAVRSFFLKLGDISRERYYPTLLPRMCLNRYYLAEGVKLYSQETWKLVVGTNGRSLVAKYAKEVVAYYVTMCDYDNHVVRESGCHCVAELGTKIGKEAIEPFVPQLLDALLICFRDDSWPVRDAACVASGQFVVGFPEASRSHLETLYSLWVEHLSDNIWSVREDAAVALGNAIRAYGEEMLVRVCDLTRDYLSKANKQKPMSMMEYEAQLKDEKNHMGNQVYSCGSLAPKLRKGGCSDCRFHRPKELWEYTDGAVYMVRELCSVAPARAVEFLPTLADVAILRHFPQTSNLQETLWKQLPHICLALGKKKFKSFMELFFDPLVFTIQGAASNSTRLSQHAAKDCVRLLSMHVGRIIFVGRLEQNDTWKDVLGAHVSPVP